MKIQYITKTETVREIREKMLSARRLGADVETGGLDFIQDELRLLQIAVNPEDVTIFDFRKMNPKSQEFDFLRDIFADEKQVKIFHNGKFDLKFLMKNLGIRTFRSVNDTMLASQVLACGDETIRHNLGANVARYNLTDIDKTLQTSDWKLNELSHSQLKYAAFDASILFDLSRKQTELLKAFDLLRVAYLEFNALPAFADLEHTGLYLNQEKWLKRIENQEKQRITFAEKLHNHFLPISKQGNFFGQSDVDLDSPLDVAKALKALGVPIDESTLEDKIKHLKDEWEVIRDLISYREPVTALKMYGKKYLQFINAITNRIHADFKQNGTPTGRTRCSEPNLQQVPTGEEYRSCIQPENSHRKLIIADYSQIETRIMAEFSNEQKLIDAFLRGEDMHSATAANVFKKPYEQCGKGTKERRLGKDLNFGTAYKVGAKRFSVMAEIPVIEADKLLKTYWGTYKDLGNYFEECEKRVIREREIRSHSGRTWRFDFDETDLKAAGTVERNGRNMPIQGTCSDIFKRALFLLNEALQKYDNAHLVNIIHDEIIVECNTSDSEAVARDLERTMKEAGEEVLYKVPCKVDAQIADFWTKD